MAKEFVIKVDEKEEKVLNELAKHEDVSEFVVSVIKQHVEDAEAFEEIKKKYEELVAKHETK